MKTTLFLTCAFLLFSAPAAAQKKSSPYLECRKTARSERDCRHLMDPNLRKALEHQEETGRRSAAHLEEQNRKDQTYQRDGRWR
ncbi:MAG: hypothetical protein KF891_03670 [Rhizobacter sp.]|nr:hypothetical protein [Rhizobacter sp.]